MGFVAPLQMGMQWQQRLQSNVKISAMIYLDSMVCGIADKPYRFLFDSNRRYLFLIPINY